MSGRRRLRRWLAEETGAAWSETRRPKREGKVPWGACPHSALLATVRLAAEWSGATRRGRVNAA
jgi:hypothetical protein